MNLANLADDALSRLVANCAYEAVSHGPERSLALAKLHNAYPEIERRSAGLDDKGLLALMGYRVGHREGTAEERRRAVLAFVHQYPLPRVRDGRYMARWGEPGTECRRKQIEGILEWFLRQHRGEPLLERACAEWAADLEFVRSTRFLGSAERAPGAATLTTRRLREPALEAGLNRARRPKPKLTKSQRRQLTEALAVGPRIPTASAKLAERRPHDRCTKMAARPPKSRT